MARKKFKVTLPSGETVWLTGDTINEAFASGLAKYGTGTPPPKETMTLREFVDQRYRKSYIEGLAGTTVANYERYLKLYIMPQLGDMQIDTIQVDTIQRFYNWLAAGKKNGLSKNINQKSIERISGLLERIFRVATEMGIVSETPIKKTLLRNNGEPAGHHKALSVEDITKVKNGLSSLPQERQRLMFGLLSYTGMRPEEVLGLRWESVHLDEGFCEVARTVTYPDKSCAVIRECGKTKASIRPVILPDPLVRLLRNSQYKEGYVVYGKDIESPLAYSTYQRTYRTAFDALGIKGHNCYDFRTTFGTELVENGFTSKEAADLMGHADTRMVETTYARRRTHGVMIKRDRVNQLNSAFSA